MKSVFVSTFILVSFCLSVNVWAQSGQVRSDESLGPFDLGYVISALKILAGLYPDAIQDTDGDGKTGIRDAVYALQVISGIRCTNDEFADFSLDPPEPEGGYFNQEIVIFQAEWNPIPDGPIAAYTWYKDGEFVSNDPQTEITFERKSDWWPTVYPVNIKLEVIAKDGCEYSSSRILSISF